MSVLIKGMEMPTSCFDCYWRCKVDPENLLCRISGEYFEETFSTIKGRHNSCPLVPVPTHGRLIDADAFTALMFADPYQDFVHIIEQMPTIIPASEEGE